MPEMKAGLSFLSVSQVFASRAGEHDVVLFWAVEEAFPPGVRLAVRLEWVSDWRIPVPVR